MRTPASISGHPIHPMLVPIAIGGFVLSFVFDLVCLATGKIEPWSIVAYYTMIGGIVGALIAALFGFVDLFSLPAGHTKKVGLTHMGINLAVVLLFICNAWIRHSQPEAAGPIWLSLIAILALLVSGWLGGKMVFEAGVGVVAGEAAEASRPAAPRQKYS